MVSVQKTAMKSYWIRCEKCAAELLHGTTPPAREVTHCITARALRMACTKRYCKPVLDERDEPLSLIDQIRMGLVDEAQAWRQLRPKTNPPEEATP